MVCARMCVCVVRERERERGRAGVSLCGHIHFLHFLRFIFISISYPPASLINFPSENRKQSGLKVIDPTAVARDQRIPLRDSVTDSEFYQNLKL